jgi:NADH-quinone oxidoreductase subunit E
MLSPGEQREINEHLEHYPDTRAASIEALKVVQRHRGFVSDEALADLAELLHLSTAELEAVATFYNLIFRKPVGDHVILACDSVSCWIFGCEKLRGSLESRLGIHLGETTPDGRFTLLPIVCLGACDRAPALMIDSDLYGRVSAEKLDEILARYPKREPV